MAITKTTKLQRIEVYPAADSSAADTSNKKHESLVVYYNDILDDSTDADLPVIVTRTKHLHKYVEDGGSATNYSGEDALVQTVCAAIWS
tara:strand:- start:74 stop:340 length:267 start_codon:yes stop_codon:yes gene_type:complete